MTLAIRRAGEGDAAAVRALTRRAYAQWVPVIGREPLPMMADHAVAIRDDRVDIGLDEGRLVALVHMVARPDDLLIENLAVDPDAQGRGLGDGMLAHAERVALATGCPVVRLYTNAMFATNLRFYARRGYAPEREERFAGVVVVHMVKAVPATAAG